LILVRISCLWIGRVTNFDSCAKGPPVNMNVHTQQHRLFSKEWLCLVDSGKWLTKYELLLSNDVLVEIDCSVTVWSDVIKCI